MQIEVDTSNSGHIVRRPQPKSASLEVAEKIVLFFTISDFYLNCGRVGSFQALIGSTLILNSSAMNVNVYYLSLILVINAGIIVIQ